MNITTIIITTMEEKKKRANACRKSHAKINLFLDVIAKRSDGFHQIRTIFSEIDLFDTINYFLTENIDIRILSDKDFLCNEKNLIYQIAFFLQKKHNVKKGVEVVLEKKIPISAGLGGGSSNAAQTILALQKLWDLQISNIEINKIASMFGSDINFFLTGGCALGEGRGEQITLVNDLNISNILLINPGFAISSKEAYEIVEIPEKENPDWKQFLKTKNKTFCFNSLEKSICRKYPEIQKIISHLKKNGAENAILSGSGATVIGFFKNYETAKTNSDYYTKKKYWNTITKTKRRTK